MPRYRYLLAVLTVGLLGATGLGSQEQDAATAASLQAVTAVRPLVRGGPVALDVSSLCTANLGRWRCPGPVSEALGRLDLTPGSSTFLHICPEGPRSCRLVGVRHLMVLERTRIRGRNAEVRVRVLSAPSAEGGRPRGTGYTVQLVRRGSGWRTVEVESGR
jgi:hypothetical protein